MVQQVRSLTKSHKLLFYKIIVHSIIVKFHLYFRNDKVKVSCKVAAFFVDRSVLPELSEEDEYYEADLIGLDVKTPQNSETVGTVAGLYNFGAGEILEIKVKATGKLEMIPFNRQYVPEVNVKDGYIIVESVLLNFMEDEEDGEGDEG